MTDSGAPPLNPTLLKLEAVLRGIEERTPHTVGCNAIDEHGKPYDGAHLGFPYGFACTCDRPARVRAEQARTVERMGDVMVKHCLPGASAANYAGAWAAALRAVAPNPGTETR